MEDFLNFSREQIAFCLKTNRISPIHADNIFKHYYQNQIFDFNGYQPKRVHDYFKKNFIPINVNISLFKKSSIDSSTKLIIKLIDGLKVESVIIPETNRITLCLSTQVGCRQGCKFCKTSRMGFKRNLTAGEIIGQVILANKWLKENSGPITNVVFMGMGEPLENVNEVIKSVNILTDQLGLNIGLKKISVSTSGYLDGLYKLIKAFPNLPIAISLNSPFNKQRIELMPITARWPIKDIISSIKFIEQISNKPPLIQYVLIKDINDSKAHAKKLAELFKGINIKINLIPFNDINDKKFSAPEIDKIFSFQDFLYKQGFRVMIRFSKGKDISGACGELISNN